MLFVIHQTECLVLNNSENATVQWSEHSTISLNFPSMEIEERKKVIFTTLQYFGVNFQTICEDRKQILFYNVQSYFK